MSVMNVLSHSVLLQNATERPACVSTYYCSKTAVLLLHEAGADFEQCFALHVTISGNTNPFTIRLKVRDLQQSSSV